MIARTCELARRMAERLATESGISIVNHVVLNQVLVHFESDAITRDVIARVQADGTCWAGGARWHDQQVMRISVSNWSTTNDDIDRSAGAIVRCYREARIGGRPKQDP